MSLALISELMHKSRFIWLVLVLNLIIEAITSPEFEDGLRMGALSRGCWCSCGNRAVARSELLGGPAIVVQIIGGARTHISTFNKKIST